MTRAAAKIKAENEEKNKLLSALKFAAAAIEKGDNVGLDAFCTIRNGMLIAQNETFSLGMPIVSDLDICLHAAKFEASLENCNDQFTVTQVSQSELSVRSGAFRSIIPILPSDVIAWLMPQPELYGPLPPDIWQGFKACEKICPGKGYRAYHQGLILRRNSIASTNGGIALEYWHGADFPEPLIVPKKTATALGKLEKSVAGFSYGKNILTIYFSDNSFLCTRLLSITWPSSFDTLFADNLRDNWQNVWPNMVNAMSAISKFIEGDNVFLHPGKLATHTYLEHAAASYEVANLPGKYCFAYSYMRIALQFAERFSIAPVGVPWAFSGGKVRGLIIGKNG